MINILFTCAGRRVELVQQFINARNELNIKGKIVCADMDILSPALYFADEYYILPSLKDSAYIESLGNLCIKEKINLIIPTIDTELEFLCSNFAWLKSLGTDVLISEKETVAIAKDKWQTYLFFNSIGLKTPISFKKTDKDFSLAFPCFIKPLQGSSSINAFKVANEEELLFFKNYIGNYIIQEFIEGEEYTVDVFCDFEGKPVYITPRIRIATRSGEVMKTRINHDLELIEDVLKIINNLKTKGPLTVQAIRSKKDGKFYFIEINARFGGGAPLSMMAGADSATALYKILCGEKLAYQPFAAEEGAIFLRFDQSIRVDNYGN